MPTQQNGHTFKQLSAGGNNSLTKLGIANIVDKKTIPVLRFPGKQQEYKVFFPEEVFFHLLFLIASDGYFGFWKSI